MRAGTGLTWAHVVSVLFPARYVQGRDATASLGEQIAHLGLSGALIVASASVTAMLKDHWQAGLTPHGIDFTVHQFGGECSQLEIDSGIEAARNARSALVIGAGGGKALDTARAISSELGLPIVNCPTLASSDAPAVRYLWRIPRMEYSKGSFSIRGTRTWFWSIRLWLRRLRAGSWCRGWAMPSQHGMRRER